MNQSKQQTLCFVVCRCRRGLGRSRTIARKFSIGGFAFVQGGLTF